MKIILRYKNYHKQSKTYQKNLLNVIKLKEAIYPKIKKSMLNVLILFLWNNLNKNNK